MQRLSVACAVCALVSSCATPPTQPGDHQAATIQIVGFADAAGEITPLDPCVTVRLEVWADHRRFGPAEAAYETGRVSIGDLPAGEVTVRVSRLDEHYEVIDYSERSAHLLSGPNMLRMPQFVKEWIDPELGVRIGFARSWELNGNVSDPVVIAIERPMSQLDAAEWPRILVETKAVDARHLRLALGDQMREAFPDATVSQPELHTISGIACAEVVFEVDREGVLERRQAMLATIGNHRVFIQIICRDDIFNNNNAVREELIYARETIEFIR